MKQFKSSKFEKVCNGDRKLAIEQAIQFLRDTWPTLGYTDVRRFTWRCDDGSGFTITCTPKSNTVYCSHKWNAARK